MKAFRSLTALLLVGCMLLSMAACATSTPPSDTDNDPVTDAPDLTTLPDETEAELPPNADPNEPFYLIRDGKPACYLIIPGVSSDKTKAAVAGILARIRELCGITPYQLTDTGVDKNESFPMVLCGDTRLSEYSLMGEATSYQYALARMDNDLYVLSHTPGGRLDALETLTAAITVSEDGQSVYIPTDAIGIYDREVEDVTHAFSSFTVSYYGPPSFSTYDPAQWNEQDKQTFADILNFGVNQVPVYAYGVTDAAEQEAVHAMIARFHENGIGVRLYALSEFTADEVRRVVEAYGDAEGITQWGFWDEPLGMDAYETCRIVMEAFDQYDEKQRPVYINMGPLAGADWCSNPENEYNNLSDIARPDYYCFDRYPFFYNENDEPAMTDKYYYANLEMNRNCAIDNSRDAGVIVASISVGGNPEVTNRADITQEFMDWQVHLMLAYGHRYLEHFVYYYAHDYCILGPGNTPTFRYDIAQSANLYAATVGGLLSDLRLDAVFHLPGEKGGYSRDVIPYYGYRNVGDVYGCDAILSFFEDGTLLLTDKRCCDADGGDHDVTLTGWGDNTEWFNPDSAEWESIRSCTAASATADGLTLTLTRASQWILRQK